MRSYASAFVLLTAILGFVNSFPTKLTGCDVNNAVLPVPAGQTTMTAPTDAKPIYIGAGFGTQNYSCSAAGTYASIGAVAQLFDASCFYEATTDTSSEISAKPFILGDHYFVPNPTGAAGVSPKFDFTSHSKKGNTNAFIVAAKKAAIPAPTNPTLNVDWLELASIPGQGNLAKYVYRIDTVGGQPPTSCAPGSAPITVPYRARYWFFK